MSPLRRAAAPAVVAVVVVVVVWQAWAGRPVDGTAVARCIMFALPAAGIYALNATGLVVVYSATGVFNLAQGAIGMVCAFVYWELSVRRNWPAWTAFVVVAAVVAPLIGVVLDALLMRRLKRAPLVTQLLATVGLLITLLGLANTIWNPNRAYPLPALGGAGGITVGGVQLSWHRVITIATALTLALVLRMVLFGSRLGVAMRAAVDDEDLAAAHGISPRRVSAAAWALGSVCAALAGVLIAPEVGNMSAETLSLLVFDSFAAAIIGRLKSLPMTYVGAVLLGLSISFSNTFLRFGGRWSGVPGALPAILLVAVLLLAPPAAVAIGRTVRSYRVERVPTAATAVTGAVIVVAAAGAAAGVLSDVNVVRLTAGVVTGIVLLAMVPLVGWSGLPFLAPFALAGFGAVFTWKFAEVMPGGIAVACAGVATAAVGMLGALPALRLRGLYLALSSIALAVVAADVVFTQPETLSTPRPLRRPGIVGLALGSDRTFLVVSAAVYAALATGLVAIRRSRLGRRLVACRDSEAAAATLGISLAATKITAFGVAGLVAGFGGGVLAIGQRFASAAQFPMIGGLAVLLTLAVWGVGTVSGPLLAGVTAVVLQVVSHDLAPGTATRALELIGPGLAALALVGLPRGQVPELAARGRAAPWGVAPRVAAGAAGGAVGVLFHLPGVVGVALAVIGMVLADAALATVADRRADAGRSRLVDGPIEPDPGDVHGLDRALALPIVHRWPR